jgi:hypothetical protein
MYFVGWGDKKIRLKWEDVIVVEKASTIMGTVDNSIRIAFDSGDGPSSYFFGSFAFRDESFQLCTQLSTVAKSLSELTGGKKKAKNLSQVPPDKVMTKMEHIFSKKLKNVSIQRFYEICWSEGNKTDEAPFYGPWLELKGSEDVKVSEWDFSEDGSDTISNEWCGEKYRQKRVSLCQVHCRIKDIRAYVFVFVCAFRHCFKRLLMDRLIVRRRLLHLGSSGRHICMSDRLLRVSLRRNIVVYREMTNV